ncbi:MAG: hypothetical protein OK452_08450, partial [Thaumarchaeota archaeon]|nr:hypothetical protein [Nitrososphaerota archaeon]
MDDARRWADKYRNGASILRIAEGEGVDPGTVSSWLKRLGLEIKQGQHRVAQVSLKIPTALVDVISRGPEEVIALAKEGVWGVQTTSTGIAQLEKFCKFVELHREGKGVKKIANNLEVHRSTVAQWREGTDEPYLVKLASLLTHARSREGWRLLPLTVESGGN